MLSDLAQLAGFAEATSLSFFLVFARISGIAAMLPGFGERSIPMRVRVGLALSFTLLVWPMISSNISPPGPQATALFLALLGEIVVGLAFGLTIRLLVLALQFAGSVAAQSTALAQIMGASATPDPMPAMGNILIISGIALAVASDLHVKAVLTISSTYDIIPVGGFLPSANDITNWGVAHAARAFSLGLSMAAPFVIASLAYNITLGFISRAMPQLMVAFIFAPAITAGGLALLLISAPITLTLWLQHLDMLLSMPFELPR